MGRRNSTLTVEDALDVVLVVFGVCSHLFGFELHADTRPVRHIQAAVLNLPEAALYDIVCQFVQAALVGQNEVGGRRT